MAGGPLSFRAVPFPPIGSTNSRRSSQSHGLDTKSRLPDSSKSNANAASWPKSDPNRQYFVKKRHCKVCRGALYPVQWWSRGRGSVKLFLRPAVVGFRSARACWTGQWPQPLSHGMEYALQTVVRVPLFAIFSQPPLLPRFLQFPHSSRHLLLPFGTRQGKVRSFGPSNLSPHFFLLFPSTSTLSIHRGPAFHTPRTSFAPFTPSVNAPGDQRGRGTRCFHLPGGPRHKTTIRRWTLDEHLKVRAKLVHVIFHYFVICKTGRCSLFRNTIGNPFNFNVSILQYCKFNVSEQSQCNCVVTSSVSQYPIFQYSFLSNILI